MHPAGEVISGEAVDHLPPLHARLVRQMVGRIRSPNDRSLLGQLQQHQLCARSSSSRSHFFPEPTFFHGLWKKSRPLAVPLSSRALRGGSPTLAGRIEFSAMSTSLLGIES